MVRRNPEPLTSCIQTYILTYLYTYLHTYYNGICRYGEKPVVVVVVVVVYVVMGEWGIKTGKLKS